MRWWCFWAAVGRVYRGPASSSTTACSQLCLFKLACLYLFSHVTLPPAAQTWWQYVSKIVLSRTFDGCHFAITELMEMCQSTEPCRFCCILYHILCLRRKYSSTKKMIQPLLPRFKMFKLSAVCNKQINAADISAFSQFVTK